ncbi:MAG TPA: sterol carrier protein domain-containing protein, partial [Clostridia bacterium]|nr:sterol carrier protein domain-containing protein [Clostridia bacterium]
EPYDVTIRTAPGGMLRVVDVAGALRRMRRPERTARFTLAVTDPALPENNGAFRVVLDGSEAEVIREDAAAPDLATDIPTLTQLICGSRSPAQLLQSGANLTVTGNLETLSRVFVPRPIHMVEGF